MDMLKTGADMLTPHERRSELAKILARGLVRVQQRDVHPQEAPAVPAGASLDSAGEKSVHRAQERVAERKRGGCK